MVKAPTNSELYQLSHTIAHLLARYSSTQIKSIAQHSRRFLTQNLPLRFATRFFQILALGIPRPCTPLWHTPRVYGSLVLNAIRL